jgi:hypothetical protein
VPEPPAQPVSQPGDLWLLGAKVLIADNKLALNAGWDMRLRALRA